MEKATEFLRDQPETLRNLQRVFDLIDGFETNSGMELLASVHWVATHDDEPAQDAQAAARAVHAWNERKQQFEPEQIELAWDTLREKGWLPD